MKIEKELGHKMTLMNNNLKISGRMYTSEQFGEDEETRKEVCEQSNMSSIQKEQLVTDPCIKRKRREGLIRRWGI